MTFLNILEQTLLKDERFVAEDGNVLKVKVYDAAMAMDENLLALLLSEDVLRDHFFRDVNGALVFDKVEFTWVLNSREFLPDSYTMYKNRIGLVDASGDLISQKQDVTLVWPYKDCVLEGGQTKDDEKRDEVFYNETLAPDQVTRLLYPKALTNAKRYSYSGDIDITGKPIGGEGTVSCEPVTEFKDDDNFIVKGNNLLALSSLLRRYEGKVKLIYIDPPYNTGSDSFGYNDSFNRSTWLSFMKNRLEISKRLLSKDGAIFVSIDEKQEAYLKILMDEIFDESNLLEVFHIQVRYTNKSLNEKNDFQPVMEYVLAYANDKRMFIPNKPFKDYDLSKFKWEVIEKTPGKIIELGGKKVEIFSKEQYEIRRANRPNINALKDTWASGAVLTGNTSGKFFDEHLSKRKNIDGLNTLYKVYGIGEDGLGYRYFTGPKRPNAIRGQFFSGVPIIRREEIENGKTKKYYPIVNLIKVENITEEEERVAQYKDLSGSFGNIRHEGGVPFNSGKKPEVMLQEFMNIASNPGDLVLDYFVGSGTTLAVAQKMGRQYLGVEQMDYMDEKVIMRLKNVIAGEQTGISKDVGWHGGGSFVYCELAERSEVLMDRLQSANDSNSIIAILDEATDKGLLRPSVLPEDLKQTRDEFLDLSLEEQRRLVMELIDKNKLYVNLCDMEDKNMNISEADKAFTHSFYKLDKDMEA